MRSIALSVGLLVALPLVGCGGGSGSNSPTPAPTPAPTSAPSPTPTPTPTPVAACAPGLTDAGMVNGRQVCDLPSLVNADLTLGRVPNVIYRLRGTVYVGTDCGYDPAAPYAGCAPATLTIEPGVTIVADQASTALIVRRGSKIDAVGTPSAPIVFTSEAQLTGTVSDSSTGLWYGIGLLGRAFIADCLEPAYSPRCDMPFGVGFTNATFGGGTEDETSGTMRYVQIRFATNGLSPYGVGGRTVIDHIHIHNPTDYGLTTWGGRVNFRYMAITGGSGVNIDHGYRGTMQYLVAVQDPFQSNIALQVDRFYGVGHDAGFVPRTYLRLSNATLVQTRDRTSYAISMEGGADLALLNTVLVTPQTCLTGRDGETVGAANPARRDVGPPVFRSVVMQCGTPFRSGQGGQVSDTTLASLFGSGSNFNNAFFTSSLTGFFVDGPNENAIRATDPTTYIPDAYADPITAPPNLLTVASFVGAIQGSSDTGFQGWTCNAGYFSFGASGMSCNALPPS